MCHVLAIFMREREREREREMGHRMEVWNGNVCEFDVGIRDLIGN